MAQIDPSAGTLGPNNGQLPYNVGSNATANTYGQGTWNTPSGKPTPDMERVSATKPLLKNFGATGTAIFAGIITNEEYNPDFYWRDAIKIYERMLRDDGQIKAIREQMELPLRAATWSIEPASDSEDDVEIAAFVESCLFHDMKYTTADGRVLTQKWDDTLRHILLHLWFGFIPFEVCWKIEDGWVKWARWTPLLPRTVWRWWVGADNELTGIQQWTYKDYSYQFVNIPADKMLLFVNRQEGNNYEGFSELRNAYKHWFYKVNFEKIDAIGIERNAVVPPVIWLPDNFTDDDVKSAQTVASNIRVNELGGITMPPRSKGWDLEYPKNMQKYAMQVQPSIQYHDIMIARSVLAQFLNLGSTETGAYSLNDSQLDSFRSALQAKAHYIEDVINSDAIPRLVDYNFAGVGVYPKLKCSKIALQDMTRLAGLLQQLAFYVPPSQEISDWLAEQLGIPVAPGNVVQTTNPTNPSDPARPDTQPGDHSDDEGDDVTGQPSGSEPDASGPDSGSSAGAAAAQALAELALLRESIDAVWGIDAVERGMTFAGGKNEVETKAPKVVSTTATTVRPPKAKAPDVRRKVKAAPGMKTLEQHTCAELKAMARAQGVKAARTKAETIQRLRSAGAQ